MSAPTEDLLGQDWLTVREVAEALRVSKMTVYRLAADREVESTQVGRSCRISRTSLEEYLNARTTRRVERG